MLNWEDYYFIVEHSGRWAGYRHMSQDKGYIIVNRDTGVAARDVVFRTRMHALRSVKRLMQRLEIEAENTLLGKEST